MPFLGSAIEIPLLLHSPTNFPPLGWLSAGITPQGTGDGKNPSSSLHGNNGLCSFLTYLSHLQRGWRNLFDCSPCSWHPQLMSNILCLCPAAQNQHQKNPQKLSNTETNCAAVGRVTHHPNSWHSHRNHSGKREKPQKNWQDKTHMVKSVILVKKKKNLHVQIPPQLSSSSGTQG